MALGIPMPSDEPGPMIRTLGDGCRNPDCGRSLVCCDAIRHVHYQRCCDGCTHVLETQTNAPGVTVDGPDE